MIALLSPEIPRIAGGSKNQQHISIALSAVDAVRIACYWLDDRGCTPCRYDGEMTSTRCSLLARQPSAMVLWLHTVCVLQCVLWFPDYEHFSFQGLHVTNGGEDCSFHLMEGSVPVRTSGLVR